MKPGYTTTEFYITVLSTLIVGWMVSHGIVASSHANALTQVFISFFGGLVTLLLPSFYIAWRSWLKHQYGLQLTYQRTSNQKQTTVIPSTASTSSKTGEAVTLPVQNANQTPGVA